MRKIALALATAGTLAVASITAPTPAEARGWFGPAVVGGLAAGALIGGLAASSYGWGWGPAYGYYGGYAPAYWGGYAPAYDAYAYDYDTYYPGYYGGYNVVTYGYAPHYYGLSVPPCVPSGLCLLSWAAVLSSLAPPLASLVSVGQTRLDLGPAGLLCLAASPAKEADVAPHSVAEQACLLPADQRVQHARAQTTCV